MPTMSGIRDCLTTISEVFEIPRNVAITKIFQMSKLLERANSKPADALSRNDDLTMINMVLLPIRSTSTPMSGERMVPANLSAPYTPRIRGEFDFSRMNQERITNSMYSAQ